MRNRVTTLALAALLIGLMITAHAPGQSVKRNPAGQNQPETNTARPGGDLPGDPQIQLVKIAGGFVDPVNVVSAHDGSGRLFVVERSGTVRVVEPDGTVRNQAFIDLRQDVVTAFLEQGLYDIEFHPEFEDNGYFYAHYSDMMRNGDSMIVRYTVSEEDPNRAEPSTAKPIMQIDQPWANHNGGELAFGPDGYLYIGSGDGGWEGDPLGAGQDLSTLLGKILRIDVDVEGKRQYAIPEDNPFNEPLQRIQLFGVTEDEFAQIHTEARPEIWAYGLRNPWKFQFDPETGDMYIAEVGQNHWEEVNFQPADSEGGENYGWDWVMGTHVHPIQKEEGPMVGVPPIAEYSHDDAGICIVGLGVYRGERYPALDGIYFVGDWGSGRIWGIDRRSGGQWRMQELLDTKLLLTGAGQDPDGTIYVTDAKASYGSRNAPRDNPPGSLWKLVAADRVPDGAETAPVDKKKQE